MATMMEMIEEARRHWSRANERLSSLEKAYPDLRERVAFLEGVVKTLSEQAEWQSQLILELVKRAPQGPSETFPESIGAIDAHMTIDQIKRQQILYDGLEDLSDPDVASFVAEAEGRSSAPQAFDDGVIVEDGAIPHSVQEEIDVPFPKRNPLD